jgi:hypothetical protein
MSWTIGDVGVMSSSASGKTLGLIASPVGTVGLFSGARKGERPECEANNPYLELIVNKVWRQTTTRRTKTHRGVLVPVFTG